jgi:hypothetical protein
MEPSEGLPRVGREVSVISFGLFCGASAINGMPPLEAVVREGGASVAREHADGRGLLR